MNDSTTTRTAADTLRAVAELIEAHPDLPVPFTSLYDHRPETADLHWYLHLAHRDPANAGDKARAIITALGGTWSKDFNRTDDTARFTRRWNGLSLEVSVQREQVCTRRVVGTETVTIPARPAAAAVPERTETRDLVEWDCGSLLADQDQAVSA
ncbi:hypothetical protein [Nocardioides sp. AX2bis]|uniref:hypothetical protein n=1 Tax=Nocardioides sp. AX2bis TaxID=2653157 RepID=UPI0012F348A6|nr:hypothetical protein [Nocardioides sp. AX2bis]VXB34069.1 conserved hypothetical protein [Nocardioides sp. AX2bis]